MNETIPAGTTPAAQKGQSVDEYYDAFWETLSRADTHASNVYRYHLIAAALKRSVSRVECMADLGCGNSTVYTYLSRAVPIGRYIGFDVSPRIVEFCRKLNRPGCAYHQMDLQKPLAPEYNATADTAISCEVIEHLPEYRTLLGTMAAVLKPGGVLILTTPSGKLHRLEAELFGHIRHFDRDALAAEVEGFGFDIVEKRNCGFPVLNMERAFASLFVDRLRNSLNSGFENSLLFKLINGAVRAGLACSSKRFGCQLVIVARKKK